MAISEGQLEVWAKIPSTTEKDKMKYTHELIREALNKKIPVEDIKKKFNLLKYDYEPYLQGSYANQTYIRFNSDVDVVVQLNSIFFYDLSGLPEDQKEYYKKAGYTDSLYKFLDYKKDIYAALQGYFGQSTVEWRDKCLRLKASTDRVQADIVPAMIHKKFKWFYTAKEDGHEFIEGIKFINTSNDTAIINYPKLHSKNLSFKNQALNGRYKEVVRIFKNICVKLVESGKIDEKLAPSYFIENMLYNTSEACFQGSYRETLSNIFQQLSDDATGGRLIGYKCANEQDSLISSTTWQLDHAITFISASGKFFLNG